MPFIGSQKSLPQIDLLCPFLSADHLGSYHMNMEAILPEYNGDLSLFMTGPQVIVFCLFNHTLPIIFEFLNTLSLLHYELRHFEKPLLSIVV